MGILNGFTNGTKTASNGASSSMDAQSLRAVLENVIDPDLHQTLGTLSAIHNVEVEGDTVRVYLLLHAPLHFAAERINTACKEAIHKVFPQAKGEIFVQEKLAERPANRPLANVKHLIAVASGKGGVGKSTISANLAAALARKGAVVGLIDADIHGPSVPTMFDLEEEELRGTKNEQGQFIGHPMEKYGVKLVSMGFVMGRDQAAIMRGPMQAGYLNTFIEQIAWGELDYLLFDLPPGTGDIQLTMAQRVPLTGAVIVTTPQNLALADVRRGISMFNRVNIPTLGVIENMSYYVLPDGSRDYIFGQGGGEKIAKEMNAPFLGEVPLNINVRKGGDEGLPVVLNDHAPMQQRAIMELAEKLASEIRRRGAQGQQVPTVQIAI
ncbi:MAG: Mrp/NBP35 family ATP-binding protein [Candidatus Kapabacteria bacterium]|jgi:ATP-binding protein involved in chromosome partitioning|nr:Mrp/NBP35 family ATP-binding protein [Candidatus Kapabacteria bacterium]